MNKADVVSMMDMIYEYVSCICANYDAKGGTMSKNAYTTRTRLPIRETVSAAS